MVVTGKEIRIEVPNGLKLGEYLNQLVSYLDKAGSDQVAATAAAWVNKACDSAMPRDVADSMARLALTVYAYRK